MIKGRDFQNVTDGACDCDKYAIIPQVQTTGKYHGNSSAIYNKAV